MASAVDASPRAASGATALEVLGELRVLYLVYLPGAVALVALAVARGLSPLVLPALVLAGGLLWTLLEYLIHRFALHLGFRGAIRRHVAGKHILHHKDAAVHSGIVVLPFSAAVALVVFAALAAAVGLTPGMAIMAGVFLGYLGYEYVHLAIHRAGPLPPIWGDRILAHHLYHHQRSARANYAVLAPIWDRLFLTLGRPRPDSR
jgi:sterol desaturase/sphingolipid hydroxylase (fatty acid hydroxylase superfamily)